MWIFAFEFDPRLAAAGRVIKEHRALCIERAQHIEAVAFKIVIAGNIRQHPERIDDVDRAELAPVWRANRRRLPTRVKHEPTFVFELKTVVVADARILAGAVAAYDYNRFRAGKLDFGTDFSGAFVAVAPKIKGIRRSGADHRLAGKRPSHFFNLARFEISGERLCRAGSTPHARLSLRQARPWACPVPSPEGEL